MDKNGLLVVLLFLFMIAFGRSNAFNSRKLVMTPDPNGSSNANQDPPLSSPPPEEKKKNPSPVGASEPKGTSMTNPSNVESNSLNDANTTKSSENSSDKKLDKGKSQDGKEKVENENQSKTFGSISCKGNPICSDQKKTMIACIQDIESGSNKLTLVLQNEQDIDLNVTIILGTFTNKLPLPGHGTEKVNITFSGDKSTKVILNAGNGDCELQIGQTKTTAVDDTSKSKDADVNSKAKDVNDTADTPAKPKDVKNPADSPAKPKEGDDPAKSKPEDIPSKGKEANSPAKPKNVDSPVKSKDVIDSPVKSKDVVDDPSKSRVDDPLKPNVPTKPTTSVDAQNNFLDQLSFYSKQVTPMYGAYFAFLVALVIGGSWALCSFRKRRSDGGVPYQELEMGLPESSHVETAEGWDADWDDDDWDEDKAIRSPGISSNGLTSRGSKKDGWDADWDD